MLGWVPAAHCNKIENSKDIFGSSTCKVTFGFKYVKVCVGGGGRFADFLIFLKYPMKMK